VCHRRNNPTRKTAANAPATTSKTCNHAGVSLSIPSPSPNGVGSACSMIGVGASASASMGCSGATSGSVSDAASAASTTLGPWGSSPSADGTGSRERVGRDFWARCMSRQVLETIRSTQAFRFSPRNRLNARYAETKLSYTSSSAKAQSLSIRRARLYACVWWSSITQLKHAKLPASSVTCRLAWGMCG